MRILNAILDKLAMDQITPCASLRKFEKGNSLFDDREQVNIIILSVFIVVLG